MKEHLKRTGKEFIMTAQTASKPLPKLPPLPPPPKPPTAPLAAAPRSKPAAGKPTTHIQFSSEPKHHGQRIVIYGPGGIGKTSLACMAPGPIAIFDIEESLGVLISQMPIDMEIHFVDAMNFQDIRDALNTQHGWDNIKTIVIDSVTRVEEMIAAWVIKNVPHEKGLRIERIEDYGWGKGYTHIYDEFLKLMGDLDRHVRDGRNIILIAHDCTANVPNPAGDDYIRYEPRLQSPASGKNAVRLRAREWADHVLFIGYDLDAKDGKAKGTGTRTIWPVELPHCMAKSRTIDTVIPFNRNDTTIWDAIFNQKKGN